MSSVGEVVGWLPEEQLLPEDGNVLKQSAETRKLQTTPSPIQKS